MSEKINMSEKIKNYIKEEAKLVMLGLEHPKPSDFYLSAWQSTRSPVPLLIFRGLLFLGTLGIILTSIILYILDSISGYWMIYLTHWGLLSVLGATGFATAVSARAYYKGPIGTDRCLPWYVKTSWVLHNISIPLAFFITIFYWSILFEAGLVEEVWYGLDVAVHALNSVVTFLLLVSSGHPVRLLHFPHALLFGIAWVIFSIIYYFAGGINTEGHHYVYPVMNWANPGTAILYIVLTAILLITLHLFCMGIAALRDAIVARRFKTTSPYHPEEGTPLR